jgi:hypothetical protein
VKSVWNLWIESESEGQALALLEKAIGRLEVNAVGPHVVPYNHGGFIGSFEVVHDVPSWDLLVTEVLALGQRVARGWVISGGAGEGADGWSNQVSLAGIKSIQWRVVHGEAQHGEG